MPIHYKIQSLITLDDDYALPRPYVSTHYWSNLLDAAMNNTAELNQLLREASVDEINDALDTLKCAFEISRKYEPNLYRYQGFGESDIRYYPTIPSAQITAIRTNLLSNLNDNHYQPNTYLKKSDKRILENELIIKINACQNIDMLSSLYTTYINSSQLEHRRNPVFDNMRSTLFGETYSKIKKHFIENVQRRALEILDEFPPSYYISESEVWRTLFNPEHIKRGVSISFSKQFQTPVEANKNIITAPPPAYSYR